MIASATAATPTGPATELQIQSLTKRFGRGAGSVTAVDDLSFTVRTGRVTGFLGPNGAGKTTTLRCLLGLVTPSRGSALIGNRHYRELSTPTALVGAALEASGFHPGRSARDHLRIRTVASGIPAGRADELLDFVGLGDSGNRRVAGFSLGMRQRLALAAALLGRPGVLILDEPANGLDPAGIAWLRGFLRGFAADGGTVLISSHVLAEVRQTADDIVIIDRGRLVRSGGLDDLLRDAGSGQVQVAGPDLGILLRAVTEQGGTVKQGPVRSPDGPGASPGSESATQVATIIGLSSGQIGRLAHEKQVEIHQLCDLGSDLEDVFLQMTGDPQPEPGGTP